MADITPLPGSPVVTSTTFDLAALGYRCHEHLVSGVATSYRMAGAPTDDGRWAVEPAGEAPFTTRVVVYRPVDPGRFNGTVMVEWNNVTNGSDFMPTWTTAHREAIRSGFGWVGVSTQRVGIEGGTQMSEVTDDTPVHLKAIAPERYAVLDHPGDAYSFDIYSQCAQLLRDSGIEVLDGLEPQRIIAIGSSQSAMFLQTYVNAIQPRTGVFDGFLVHAWLSGLAAYVEGAGAAEPLPISFDRTVGFRDDLDVPVLVIQSETDATMPAVHRSFAQPDTDRFRLWQIAGTAHASTYTMAAAADSGLEPVEELAVQLVATSVAGGFGRTTQIECPEPINSGPHSHYVTQAGISALDSWVKGDGAPPRGARFELDADNGCEPVRDDLGIIRGGVRSPWVDVPVAALGGYSELAAGGSSMLFGFTRPFDASLLTRLYPGGKQQFVSEFEACLDAGISAGFLPSADRDEMVFVGTFMYPD